MNRLTKTLLASLTIAAVALPAGAQARQGSDDPAGHVRHAAHQTVTSAHQSRERHRHARRADDLSRHVRGADDGPKHR